MTVIRPNSIAGINSITVQSGQALNVHDASGNLIRSLTNSSGISTFSGINIGTAATIFANGNATFSGIVTATTIKGSGSLTSLDVTSGLGIAESLFHLDDTNTRMVFPSNDTIAFDTNGSERLRILSGGNVGLGTTNPTSLLHMYGAAPRITLTDTAGSDDFAKIFSTSGALYLQQRDGTAHGEIIFRTENNSSASERFRISNVGALGVAGANYGTSGQVLTSGGSGAAPSWAAAGALTPISKTTVSSNVSAVSFTEALTGAFDTYKVYVVIMDGVLCASDNEDFHLRVRHGSNGGTLYSNSDYLSMTNGPSADDSFSAADKFRLNYNNVGNLTVGSYVKEDWNMILYMHGFENNRRFRYHGTTTYMSSDGNLRGQFVNGAVTDATEVTGIEFFFTNSNNITAGTISLFGVNG